MRAGSVLRFYLWKEEKAHLLRKSRVPKKKQCWHKKQEKNALLGKHCISKMVFFCKSQAANIAFHGWQGGSSKRIQCMWNLFL